MIFVFPSVKDNLFSGYLGVDQGPLPHLMQMLGPAPPYNPLAVPPPSSFSHPLFLAHPRLGGPVGPLPALALKAQLLLPPSRKLREETPFQTSLILHPSKSRWACSVVLRAQSLPQRSPPEWMDACTLGEGSRALTDQPRLEGRGRENRKEWKVVSRSVMAIIIYLFMYFLLRRRCWPNE